MAARRLLGVVVAVAAWAALDWLGTLRLDRLADGRPLGIVSLGTVAVAALASLVIARGERPAAEAAAGVLVGGVLLGLVIVSADDAWSVAARSEWPGSAWLVLRRGSLCPAIQVVAGVAAVLARTMRRSRSIFRP